MFRLTVKDGLKELKRAPNLFTSRESVEEILCAMSLPLDSVRGALTMYEVMAEMFEISDGRNVYDLEVVAEMAMRLRAKHRGRHRGRHRQRHRHRQRQRAEHRRAGMEPDRIELVDDGLAPPSKWKSIESVDVDAPSTNGDGGGRRGTECVEPPHRALLDVIADPDRPDHGAPPIAAMDTVDTDDLDGECSDDAVVSVDVDIAVNVVNEVHSEQDLLPFLWSEFVAENGVAPRTPNQLISFSKRRGETVSFREAMAIITTKRHRAANTVLVEDDEEKQSEFVTPRGDDDHGDDGGSRWNNRKTLKVVVE